MYSRKKKKKKKKKKKTKKQTKRPLFFQYKLSYKNEAGTNHHGILSISQTDALNFFLGVHLHGGSQSNFNFFNVKPQISQRNR